MQIGDAYSSGHQVLSHLGLVSVLLVATNHIHELVLIFPDYSFRTSLGTFPILLLYTMFRYLVKWQPFIL